MSADFSLLNTDYDFMASVKPWLLGSTTWWTDSSSGGSYQSQGIPKSLSNGWGLWTYWKTRHYLTRQIKQAMLLECSRSVRLPLIGSFVYYLHWIASNEKNMLGGIQLPNQSLRVRAYVDDIAIFLYSDRGIVKAGEALHLNFLQKKW